MNDKEKIIYTPKGLLDFANKSMIQKKTGKPFTHSDIESYIQRGNFPRYLGGLVISKVKSDNIGKSVYEILNVRILNKTNKYKK